MTHDKNILHNRQILNSIDMRTMIQQYDDLSDIVNELKLRYDNTSFTNNQFLEGSILNHMDIIDLAEYIKDRYGVEYLEEIVFKKHPKHTEKTITDLYYEMEEYDPGVWDEIRFW